MTYPSPTPPQSSEGSIRVCLRVRGLEHVPSKKNSKQIIRKGNRPSLITKPERHKWIERCIRSFASQLSSTTPTCGDGTQTECSPPSLIALLNQYPGFKMDDNLHVIPEIHVRCVKVGKGEEGADIVIEHINPQPQKTSNEH